MNTRGFTLLETMIALLLLGVCFFSLLLVGQNIARHTAQEKASRLHARIIDDAQLRLARNSESTNTAWFYNALGEPVENNGAYRIAFAELHSNSVHSSSTNARAVTMLLYQQPNHLLLARQLVLP